MVTVIMRVLTTSISVAAALGFALATARGADNLQELLQKARSDMDSIHDSQNGLWFEVSGRGVVPGSSEMVQDSRGLVFRDDDYFYAVCISYRTRAGERRQFHTHYEVVASGNWIAVRDSRRNEHEVVFTELNSVASEGITNQLRQSVDIIRLLAWHIKRFVDDEFAVPESSPDYPLVVRYRLLDGRRIPGPSSAESDKIVRTAFVAGSDSRLRPDHMRLTGGTEQDDSLYGYSIVDYSEDSSGRSLLTRMYCEARRRSPSERPMIHHIEQSPTAAPDWVVDSGRPKLGASEHYSFTRRGSHPADQTVSRTLPAEIEDICIRLTTDELNLRHVQQIEQLESVPLLAESASVRPLPVESPVSPVSNVAGALLLPALAVAIPLLTVIVWLILWRRRTRNQVSS